MTNGLMSFNRSWGRQARTCIVGEEDQQLSENWLPTSMLDSPCRRRNNAGSVFSKAKVKIVGFF